MTPTSFFPETIWTVVELSHDDPEALETLCKMYRGPIFKLINHRLRDQYKPYAEDLTQAFILSFIQSDATRTADRAKGRFRTLVNSSVENFLRNWHRSRNRIKNGEGVVPLSIDEQRGEVLSLCADEDLSADEILDTELALSLHSKTLEQIRLTWMSQNQGAPLEAFSEFLDIPGDSASYTRVGRKYGLSLDQVKRRIYHMREMHAYCFKSLVSHMVPAPDLDDEFRYLSILRIKARG